MRKYTKKQTENLHAKSFATTTNSGTSVVRAYLKTNAAKFLNVPVSEVYEADFTTGAMADKIVKVEGEENMYEIVYKGDIDFEHH